jgi:hypothetical protein
MQTKMDERLKKQIVKLLKDSRLVIDNFSSFNQSGRDNHVDAICQLEKIEEVLKELIHLECESQKTIINA